MAALNEAAMADHVQSVLNDLGRGKFEEIASDLQSYEVMSHWLKKDKVTVESGRGIFRNIMTDLDDVARHVGNYAKDQPNVADHLSRLEVPWSHITTHWAYDYVADVLMDRGGSKILKLIKPRQANATISLAKQLELRAWSLRGANDNTLPFGIPYWITQSASASGFNGMAASGFTTKGGINPTTTTNWRNYTYRFQSWTAADLLAEMRQAHLKIDWRSPVTVQEYRKSPNLRIYGGDSFVLKMEEICAGQNESLGRELVPYQAGRQQVKMQGGGQVTFRGHPIRYVPQLDTQGVETDIHYFVDHGAFFVHCLAGDYLRRTGPIRASGQHNVWVTYTDLTYAYLLLSPRRTAVGYRY